MLKLIDPGPMWWPNSAEKLLVVSVLMQPINSERRLQLVARSNAVAGCCCGTRRIITDDQSVKLDELLSANAALMSVYLL